MRKIFTIFTGSAFCLTTAVAQEIVPVPAKLEAVTVYKQGAQLLHKIQPQIPAGYSELVIEQVSNMIDEASIQLSAPSAVTIMSVRFAPTYEHPSKSRDTILPHDAISETERQLTAVRIGKEVAGNTLALLDANRKLGGEPNSTNVAELIKLTDYYAEKQGELRRKIAQLSEQEKQLQEQLRKLRNTPGKPEEKKKTGGYIVVQVMASQAVQPVMAVQYYATNAGWNLYYDLRSESTGKPLQFLYKANIVQSTGIDWKRVKLRLSTANPSLGNNTPRLSAWILQYGYPSYTTSPAADLLEGSVPGAVVSNPSGQPGSTSAIRIRGFSSISGNSNPLYVVDGSIYMGDIANIPPSDILSLDVIQGIQATSQYGSRASNGVVNITTRSKGVDKFTAIDVKELSTTFDIDLPYEILSNGKEHSVSLKALSHPARYHYYAIPKEDPDAFLVAEITGYGDLNLLPGTANIIFEDLYVGKTRIDPYQPNDTLLLSMGRDRKVIVKRDMIAELTGTKTSGSYKKQVFTYDITVKNTKKESIHITLKDQYPIATDHSMNIELLEHSGAEVDKETGLLTWKLTVAPGASQKLRVAYSIRYPKEKIIGNLQP